MIPAPVHSHRPALQREPAGQTLPHAPQLFASVMGLMQVPPHTIIPPTHEATQLTPMQIGVVPEHTVEQLPQCSGLFITFTHVLPQSISVPVQPASAGMSLGTSTTSGTTSPTTMSLGTSATTSGDGESLTSESAP
jgi:hypothetical protein